MAINVTPWREGTFITAARIRIYSALMIAIGIGCIAYLALHASHWLSADGQPLGADFSGIYSAGRLALAGNAAHAYDWPSHYAAQQQLFGASVPFYAWSYPPPFFLVAASLAALSYPIALLVWLAASTSFYLLAMRLLLQPSVGTHWWLPALGFGAVLINLINGHNGLFSAALFGVGLHLLRTRPFLGGLVLGALGYKPHFALLVPVALAAGGYWRGLMAAALSALLLCLCATLLFGVEIWPAFFASLAPTREILLEEGNTGWYKLQSVFAAMRNLGSSIPFAYIAQAALGMMVVIGTAMLWRSRAPYSYQAAFLSAGTLLFTPYLLDYDLAILAPALAFTVAHGMQHGFAPYQKLLLAWLWVMPLIARSFMKLTGIPLGLLSLGVFAAHLLLVARRTVTKHS